MGTETWDKHETWKQMGAVHPSVPRSSTNYVTGWGGHYCPPPLILVHKGCPTLSAHFAEGWAAVNQP